MKETGQKQLEILKLKRINQEKILNNLKKKRNNLQKLIEQTEEAIKRMDQTIEKFGISKTNPGSPESKGDSEVDSILTEVLTSEGLSTNLGSRTYNF